MSIHKGKPYLEKKDITKYSIWKVDDRDDLYYPVLSREDIPGDLYELIIRGKFRTKGGKEFFGSIVGVKHIYCIAIYVKGEKLFLNKNLPKDALLAIEKINKFLDCNLTIKDFSPIEYETDIDIEGFNNITGEIDFSKPSTLEEQLWQVNEK